MNGLINLNNKKIVNINKNLKKKLCTFFLIIFSLFFFPIKNIYSFDSSSLKVIGSEVDPMALVITPESPERISPGRVWLKMALKKYFLNLRYSLTASELEDYADNLLFEYREGLKDTDADSFFSTPMSEDPPEDSFFTKIIDETDASIVVWSRLKGYSARRSHDETWKRFSSTNKYSWIDTLFNPDKIGGKLYCKVGTRIVIWDKIEGKVCDELSVVNQQTSFFGSFRSRMEGLKRAIKEVVKKTLDNKFE